MKTIPTIPTITINGSFLQLRNAALQLGGKKNWQKRIVASAFGEEICYKALAAPESEIKAAKMLMAACFEARFTDLDKQMELAIKKAEERIIKDLPYEDEDDI